MSFISGKNIKPQEDTMQVHIEQVRQQICFDSHSTLWLRRWIFTSVAAPVKPGMVWESLVEIDSVFLSGYGDSVFLSGYGARHWVGR